MVCILVEISALRVCVPGFVPQRTPASVARLFQSFAVRLHIPRMRAGVQWLISTFASVAACSIACCMGWLKTKVSLLVQNQIVIYLLDVIVDDIGCEEGL